ncbi:MAG: class E sortase [Micropruina sp.]|nr:class E sortase [Micropruina sp.]
MAPTDTLTPPASPPASPRPQRRRWPLLTFGVLLLVTGLTLIGLYVYDAYFNPVMDVRAAKQQVDEVKKQWAQGATPSSKIPGTAVALMRIPEFGDDFEVAVMTGTTPYALNVGVGWFDGTAAPGRVGNFAVAGHRGASGPFVPLLELTIGSKVIVETRTATHVYELTNNPRELTVDKYQTWVIDPVPGHPDEKPTQKLITLVTCRNFFHSAERSVAFGTLVETIKK